jgi:all-trans-8'-apo-beta-carotenal 15,15'-oxygenase
VPLPDSLLTTQHRDLDLEVVAGTWPDDLTGEMFLSAPAVHAELSYALFGFGVMIRLSLQPGTHGAAPNRFAWRTRTIDSPTRRLHQAAPQAFAPGPLGFTSPLGSPNMVNTAPLPWGDRLLATWDVGRPAELDAVTLEHLGEIGSKQSWGGGTFPADHVLPFIFSSAHPVVDPDRNCLWTVKLTLGDGPSFAWQPTVVRYDGDGTEVRTWPVRDARLTGSMHTITQTREWLILADSGNFKADPGEMVTGERTVLIDERVPLFLVRKDDLETTPAGHDVPMRSFTLAPPTGHYYARYDDRDGVRILFENMDLVDLGYHLRADDLDVHGRPVNPAHVGMYNMAMGRSSITEVELDPHTGTLIEHARLLEDWSWNHQLSAMDWSAEGTSAPTRHHIVFQGFKPGAVSQRALHAYRERVDVSSFPGDETPSTLVSLQRGSLDPVSTWSFPSMGDLPTSPAFAPRGVGTVAGSSRHAGRDPGGHDGYVVCPVLSDDRFRVDVFDAADVGRGPVATLAAPADAAVPFLLHSAWAPQAVTAPSVERLRFADDVTPADLAGLSPDLVAAVRAVATPDAVPVVETEA